MTMDTEPMTAFRFLLARVPDILMAICFAAILGLAWLQVFRRYVLEDPAVWTEEIARLLLVWATFFAAAVACRERQLLAVDMISKLLGPRAVRISDVFNQLLVIVVAIFLVRYGISITALAWSDTSTSLGLPRGLFYLPTVAGGGLMILYAARNALQSVRGKGHA